MKQLKRWQLLLIAPVFVPLHDFAVLTGRLAGRWYAWTEDNTAGDYIFAVALRKIFSNTPTKGEP